MKVHRQSNILPEHRLRFLELQHAMSCLRRACVLVQDDHQFEIERAIDAINEVVAAIERSPVTKT